MSPEGEPPVRIRLAAPDVTEHEIEGVVKVLRTPSLSLGPRLAEFERAMARHAGTRHAVAVSSGTAGLHLAVRALGLGRGDEVITTPLSFVASSNVLVQEGARPVFVDVDARTMNLDPARVAAAVTPRTRAILVVHLFGLPAEMDAIGEIGLRHDLPVIEDACEALGARYGGRAAGSLGTAGVFGFYPNKQITTGEGGMLITDDESLAKTFRTLRNQGRSGGAWLDQIELGYNYRLSELQCALGLAQLDRLDEILSRRAIVAASYRRRLVDRSTLSLPDDGVGRASRSWFLYPVRLAARFDRADRDTIARELRQRGIACGRYFPPIHLQPVYRRLLGHEPGTFPVAEDCADRLLALPFFNAITEDQIDEVCATLDERIAARERSRAGRG